MNPILLAAAVAAFAADDAWQVAAHETLVEHLDPLLACSPSLPEHLAPAWVHLTLAVDASGAVTDVALRPQHRPPGRRLVRCLERTLGALAFPPPPGARTLVRTLFLVDGLPDEGRPGLQRVRLPLLVGGAPEETIADLDLTTIRDSPDGDQLEATAFVVDVNQVLPDLRRRLWLQRALDQLADATETCARGTRLAVTLTPDGAVTALSTPPCVAMTRVAPGPSPDGAPATLSVTRGEAGLLRSGAPVTGDVPTLSAADTAMVEAVRKRAQRGVSVCYSESLEEMPGRPPQVGELDVGVVIGSVGEVLQVPTGGALGGTSLADCVAEVHRRLEFPAPVDGGLVVLSLTYRFRPGD